MLAFGLGTVPALAGFGAASGLLGARARGAFATAVGRSSSVLGAVRHVAGLGARRRRVRRARERFADRARRCRASGAAARATCAACRSIGGRFAMTATSSAARAAGACGRAAEAGGLSELLAPSADRARATPGIRRKAAAPRGRRPPETLRVDGMWCSSCALVLEDALLACRRARRRGLLRRGARTGHLRPRAHRAATICSSASPARLRRGPRGWPVPQRRFEDLFLRFFVGAAVGMWVLWPTLFLLYPAFCARVRRPQRVELLHRRPVARGAAVQGLAVPGGRVAGGPREARDHGHARGPRYVVGVALQRVGGAHRRRPHLLRVRGDDHDDRAAGRWLEALGRRDATRSLERWPRRIGRGSVAASRSGCVGRGARVPLADVEPGALSRCARASGCRSTAASERRRARSTPRG